MITNVATMVIRLRNKLETTTETIRVVLLSRIGDLTVVLGTIDLLTLGVTDNTILLLVYWEETAVFLLLLAVDKVDLTTEELLGELESICTEVKIDFDGDIDGEQGKLARKQTK